MHLFLPIFTNPPIESEPKIIKGLVQLQVLDWILLVISLSFQIWGQKQKKLVWEEVIALLLRSWCILYRQKKSRWRGWTAFTRRIKTLGKSLHSSPSATHGTSGCTSRRLCPPHFHQCAWCTTERFLYRGGWIKPSECEWKMGFIFTQVSWWRVFWNIWKQSVQDKWFQQPSFPWNASWKIPYPFAGKDVAAFVKNRDEISGTMGPFPTK